MELITSRENPCIKAYCKLSTAKSARDTENRFVLEGVTLVAEAFENGVLFDMVFVTEECFEKNRPRLEKIFQTVRHTLISKELSRKITAQQTPQGLYAICIKLDKPIQLDKIVNSGRYIMLCDLQDTGNMGSIVRTAEALGMDGVLITAGCCDCYSPKVLRSSMGAVLRIPLLIVADPQVLLATLSGFGVCSYASVVSADAIPVTEVAFEDPAVLLIGNEGAGLPAAIQASCTKRITIPMGVGAESLNASAAACILMWELSQKR